MKSTLTSPSMINVSSAGYSSLDAILMPPHLSRGRKLTSACDLVDRADPPRRRRVLAVFEISISSWASNVIVFESASVRAGVPALRLPGPVDFALSSFILFVLAFLPGSFFCCTRLLSQSGYLFSSSSMPSSASYVGSESTKTELFYSFLPVA